MVNLLDDPSLYFLPSEVVLILSVSRMQICRLLPTELPAIHFGGSIVRVPSENLWKYIDNHKNLIGQDNDQNEQKKIAPHFVWWGVGIVPAGQSSISGAI